MILLIPSGREFDRGLRRGIVRYAQAHGPWIFHEEEPGYLRGISRRQRLRNFAAWNASGAIGHQKRLAEVTSLSIPMVAVIETRKLGKDANQICCANLEIGKTAAETLVALGLRHFAFCGLRGLEFSEGRQLGFVKAIEKAGHRAEVYGSNSRNLAQSWYMEERQLSRWLLGLPKPIGLAACNDDLGRRITELCRTHNILVPDEIAVLGVDNDEQVCNSANPPLSSIALATERAGYEAAALLASLMQEAKQCARTVLVQPSHVVSRRSTDMLAIEDPVLVKALRFIRDHSSRNISVVDVMDSCGLSRRSLQDRFQQRLGRTPMEEIHRCRIARVARLLVETNMTVREIAALAGFEMDAHVARFFARHTGMTPLEYRRRKQLPSEMGSTAQVRR